MREILHCHIRLIISCKEEFSDGFGPGTAALLRGIQMTNSLNQTAKNMGMSYSKAWKSIKATEKAIGVTFIERRGVNGSCLTTEGEAILNIFDKAQSAAQKAVEEVLSKEI